MKHPVLEQLKRTLSGTPEPVPSQLPSKYHARQRHLAVHSKQEPRFICDRRKHQDEWSL